MAHFNEDLDLFAPVAVETAKAPSSRSVPKPVEESAMEPESTPASVEAKEEGSATYSRSAPKKTVAGEEVNFKM